MEDNFYFEKRYSGSREYTTRTVFDKNRKPHFNFKRSQTYYGSMRYGFPFDNNSEYICILNKIKEVLINHGNLNTYVNHVGEKITCVLEKYFAILEKMSFSKSKDLRDKLALMKFTYHSVSNKYKEVDKHEKRVISLKHSISKLLNDITINKEKIINLKEDIKLKLKDIDDYKTQIRMYKIDSCIVANDMFYIHNKCFSTYYEPEEKFPIIIPHYAKKEENIIFPNSHHLRLPNKSIFSNFNQISEINKNNNLEINNTTKRSKSFCISLDKSKNQKGICKYYINLIKNEYQIKKRDSRKINNLKFKIKHTKEAKRFIKDKYIKQSYYNQNIKHIFNECMNELKTSYENKPSKNLPNRKSSDFPLNLREQLLEQIINDESFLNIIFQTVFK